MSGQLANLMVGQMPTLGYASGVKFLAQGNNRSRKVPAGNRTWAPSLESHDYQADALATGLLLPP